MPNNLRSFVFLLAVAMGVVALGSLTTPPVAQAASASQIDAKSTAALKHLYDTIPGSRELGARAKAILIFPSIIKAGFIFGGQYGEGALREGGRTVAYYNTIAASYGLQAGGQGFGYAMFLMNDETVRYLKESRGWEIGVGPSIVVVDAGMARTLTTTTLKKDVYAFIFDQKGIMAGLGVQGSKISRINR